jgi:nucleoside-diphosphate-sugar epimerase
MRVLITGGTGFIGKKLAAALLREGGLALDGGEARRIERLTLFDAFPGEGVPTDPRVGVVTGDIADPGVIGPLAAEADLVWHLAAIVSANAEADFELGYQVNLDGTRVLLDALRATGRRPRVVFASSLAVYGGDMPPVITDQTHLTPQTSYGAQKAMGELLVTDYSRKGFVDGRSLRLPTIAIRPGKPNKAASTFASSIIREPLAGQEAVCPVGRDAAMYYLSPRKVVAAFLHAMRLPESAGAPPAPWSCPGSRPRWATWWTRSAASPARPPSAASGGSPTPRSSASSAAGRPASRPSGRGRWASSPTRPSTRSSASTSRTSWAGGSRREVRRARLSAATGASDGGLADA